MGRAQRHPIWCVACMVISMDANMAISQIICVSLLIRLFLVCPGFFSHFNGSSAMDDAQVTCFYGTVTAQAAGEKQIAKSST